MALTIFSNGSDALSKRDAKPQGLPDCLVGLVEIGGVFPTPIHNCHITRVVVVSAICHAVPRR